MAPTCYNAFPHYRNRRRFLGFKRALGPFDATMVVVGGIIGAGIFINPYIVAQRLDSPGLVLAAWIGGGLIAMAGALTFAELGSLFPTAGGHYAYLRDAYHPLFGFLYGWALLFMIEGGAIAAVALTFAEYTFRFLGRADGSAAALAILGIVIVTVVNYLGVRPGSRLLNTFVILKVGAIAVLIAAGLVMAGAPEEAGTAAATAAEVAVATVSGSGPVAGAGSGGGLSGGLFGSLSVLFWAMGAALIPIMFSYGGWQNANYLAEEIKDPVRNLPRSLLWGTAVVVTTYVLVNLVYLKTLGHAGLAGTLTPASDAANHLFGDIGDRLIALTIAVSTFGFLNLTMLAPTRVYYAMSRDKLFVPAVARIHPKYKTPSLAIVIQSAWAIVLVLTGTYADLVDYVVFADWIFFGLAGAAVFVFRRTHPVSERPDGTFISPLYPFIPGLFVGVAILIIGSVLQSNPQGSMIGLGLLLTGVPAYFYWSRR